MYRLIAGLLALLLTALPVSTAMAQYRLPTQSGQEDLGPAPSFRGSERQIQQRNPSQKQMQMQVPSGVGGLPMTPGMGGMTMPSGSGSAAGGMGDAVMMSMGYQVHVLGEVFKPGTYRITASDRVSEVITRAGGLVENGSERNIELRRKGGGVQHVDLLAFKLFGKLDNNPYLTDNDVIYVPLRKSVIQVVGAVKRPDFYELKNEKTMENVIELAGGFTAGTAKKEPIRVIRFRDGEKFVEEVPIESESLKQYSILNGDVVVIPNIMTQGTTFDYNVGAIPGDQVFYPSYEDRVFVLGGVAMPGAYPFSPYYTLNQYVTLAGGLNERGKPNYTVTTIDGKTRHAKPDARVNPGDTIVAKQSWMSPASWMGFALGVASFGLSASATIIAIQK